ncbi:hypothetical protein [Halioxenophilus aromaticivorans]|uniref:Uncharacterized protein n=1 Tax=Halioxenophilus aromaticivorans TaxID=1306992 RepID=A0AAV3U9L6_9ALTE
MGMKTDIAYRFPTAAKASRFLAELQGGVIGRCQCKRHRDDKEIIVYYDIDLQLEGYASVAQRLDQLAESLEGSESTG